MMRAGQRSLRDHNLSLVYRHIAAADPEHPYSRADLAEITGLTKATVSSLVTDLRTARLVVELDPPAPHGVGRPAIPLVVASGTAVALGLEINVDFVGIRAVDLTGLVIDECFERTNLRSSEPHTAFTALLKMAYDVVSRLVDSSIRVIGACLALPGIADRPSGPLRLAPNLGWRDVDIIGTMATSYETFASHEDIRDDVASVLYSLLIDHLVVENEANLAARTETGQHRNESFIYVSGEVGIGAAIVVNGRVVSGVHGWAGEIGHIMVDSAGPQCACGAAGCLEMYAGKESLMVAAGFPADDNLDALLAAHDRDDPQAAAAIDRAAAALGIALSDCMNVVDVSRVVLGGSFAELSPVLMPGLLEQIHSRVLSARWVGEDLAVRAADSGTFPATTGSALAVLDHAISDPNSSLWSE
jgi:predicted NBD/HSP70 family sugar kinase